jgi:hypothetical protein
MLFQRPVRLSNQNQRGAGRHTWDSTGDGFSHCKLRVIGVSQHILTTRSSRRIRRGRGSAPSWIPRLHMQSAANFSQILRRHKARLSRYVD